MRAGHFGFLLAAGFLVLGCARGPELAYDIQEDVSVERYREIALDPRTDLIFGDGDQRAVEVPEIKGLIWRELQAKGYQVVPSQQAKLWVQIVALVESPKREERAGAGRSGGGPGGGGPGGRGGGHGRGGGGGGFGGPGGDMGGGSERSPRGEGGASVPPGGGGPMTLMVAFLEPADAKVRWRGILEIRRGNPKKPEGPQAVEEKIKRLLEPLTSGTSPAR